MRFAFRPFVLFQAAAASRRESTPGDAVSGVLATSVLLLSTGFFVTVLSIHNEDPEYFERPLMSSLEKKDVDPVITGTVGAVLRDDPIPVPSVVREYQLDPTDFEIVALFEGEALLASRDELWRVKVGSDVPGLGEILEIDVQRGGGTVRTSQATLRTAR